MLSVLPLLCGHHLQHSLNALRGSEHMDLHLSAGEILECERGPPGAQRASPALRCLRVCYVLFRHVAVGAHLLSSLGLPQMPSHPSLPYLGQLP